MVQKTDFLLTNDSIFLIYGSENLKVQFLGIFTNFRLFENFRGYLFSRIVKFWRFRGDLFSRIFAIRENKSPRKLIPAKIYPRENLYQ